VTKEGPLAVQQFLLHLPEHHVLICRLCGYAISPEAGIQRHLLDTHKTIFDLRVRKELLTYSNSYAHHKDIIILWIGQASRHTLLYDQKQSIFIGRTLKSVSHGHDGLVGSDWAIAMNLPD